MGRLKLGRKVVIALFLLLSTFQFMISQFSVPVSAEEGSGANSRLAANISWGQKKSFQQMSTDDLSSLTYDDLRMIGVFLSNFYVPWSTALGKSGTEDDTKTNMVNALVKQCNFNKDVAEALVPMVWEMVLGTAKPLSIGVLERADEERSGYQVRTTSPGSDHLIWQYVDYANFFGDANSVNHQYDMTWVSDSEDPAYGAFQGTYFNFLVCWAGQMSSDDDDTLSNDVAGVSEKCLFWCDDSGEKHVVFDTGLMRKTGADSSNSSCARVPSASMAVYGIINDNLNYGNGYGSSILAVSDLSQYESLSAEQKEAVIVTNSQLYVDCFGDILVDTGVNQYILVPACANPYCWYLDSDGESSAGRDINIVNAYMIGEIQAKHIKRQWKMRKVDDKTQMTYHTFYSVYTGSQSLFNIDYWRWFRGCNRFKTDTETGWDNGEVTTKLKDIVDNNEELFEAIGESWWDEAKLFPAWDAVYKGYSWYTNEISSFPSNYAGLGLMEDLSVTHHGKTEGWTISGNCEDSTFNAVGTGDSFKHWDANRNVGTIDSIVVIDNLNKFNTAESDDDSVFQQTNIFLDKKDTSGLNEGDKGECETIGGKMDINPVNFGSVTTDGTITTLGSSGVAKQYLTSIYLSYVFAYYDDSHGEERKIPWCYNKNNFPTDTNNIDWSNVEIVNDMFTDEVMSLAYYFLHPLKGIQMIVQWFKNKVSAILVGWHEDMVGAAGGVATSGSTRYIGFSGYVTLPNLGDLPWTSWLLSQYDSLVVYFIIVILIIMLCYVMAGSLTVQRAMLGVLVFAICAYLPPKLIDSTVNMSNKVCDAIYSSKFTYWALAQHQQYASELKQAAEAEDKQRYLAGIFTIQADNAAEDYAIVTVKWQCPKKENYMVQIRQELNAVTNGNDNIFKLISGLVSSQISGEQYVEAAQNMYLYRSYTDIAMYSSSIWNRGVKTNPLISTAGDMLDMGYRSVYSGGYGNSMRNVVVGGANENVAKTKGSKSFANLRTLAGNYLGNYGSSESSQNCYKFAEENGFLFNISPKTNNVTNSLMTSDSKYSRSASHIFLGVSSPNISAAIYEAWNDSVLTGANLESRIKQASQTNLTSSSTDWSSYFKDILVGVDQKRYSRTLAQLNAGVNDDTGFCNSVGFEGAKTLTTSANFGNFGFELYSESPYYYFSANLYDQLEALRNGDSVQLLTTTGGNDNLGYKDLFLLPDGAYFYNMTKKSGEVSDLGYGEMRDYMDMRSLFYVTIPYLKAANDVVIEWDKLQGLWMYDDVELSYDENYALEIPSEISAALNTAASTGETSPLLQKFWHNANVAQLFNMYTPWVDLMYDCEYAKSENIYVAGEKYQVTDPLNPYSYYQTDGNGNIKAGRPMVFSRSEMNAYGLELDDLTKVETKIIKMYDDLYEDLLIIMDYYNFEDEVLNTGAAMLETFAFNKYFSESTVFGEDHVMYPQSYELKNFSYDAYLRMIMAEATGEDLSVSYAETTGGSLYGQIVQESSILTAIMFIVVDLFACYAIPALKLFFVIAIFTLSVIMILAATVKLEMSLPKVLWKSLVSPLLKFFGISIGMAFAVSLFMSDGNTAVTGRGGLKISLGDPVMTLIVMLLINAVVLILYWKTAKAVAKDCITYFKAVFQSIKGVMGGAVANVASTATGGKLSKFAPVAAGMAVGSALTRGAKNTTGMFARARSKRRATSAAKKGSVQANKAQAKADNKYNKKIAKYKGKVTTDQNSLANTTKASVAGFKSEHKSVDVNATSKGDLVRAHGELDKEIQLRKGNISKANAKRELLESRNKELEATGAKKGYNIDGKATSKAEAQWQAEMSENKSAMSEIDSFVTGEKATLAKCQTEKDAVHKKVAEMTATAKKNGNVVVNGSVADAKEKIKAGSAKVSDDVKNVSRMQRGTASKMSDAELEEAFKNNKSSFYSCQNQARACAKTKADIDSNVASQRAKLVENGYSEHGIARDGAEATAQDNLTIANACSRNSANAQKFAEGQMRVSAENARDVKREWVTRHQASRESGNYKFNNANAGNQTYKNFAYQGGASMNMSTVMGDVKNLGEVNYANANGVKKRAVAEISAQQESLNRANASVEAAQRAYEQALEKGAKNGWNRDAIGSFASGSAEREWQDEINGVEKALHSSKSSVRKLEGNISQLEKLSSAADARMTEIDNKYSGKKGKRR